MDTAAQLATALAGRYTIEREIGRGGMATVFLARDERHHRRVALKVLDPDLGAVLGVERFLSEIRVTANLQHPNLLPLFDSGEADGLLFYVMPFVEGETLRHRIERERQLPVDEAVRIAVAVASALEYAHEQGVIHRDLKPENILLQAGQPVVADFGIALAVSNAGGQRVTQTGISLGTPQYMSPEQATGDRIIDARSDIYSLGAVLFELLTGEAPHTGGTMQAIIARVLTEQPRRARAIRPSTPEHVDAAIDVALAKIPADRWSSARDFAAALEGGAVSSPRAIARAVNDRGATSGVARVAIVALSVVALGATVLAARDWWTRTHLTPPPATRFTISLEGEQLEPVTGNQAVIAPDGRAIAYAARTDKGVRIFYRRLDELTSHALPGTDDPSDLVFTADGRRIAFAQRNEMKSVSVDGGAVTSIATLTVRGATPTPDGQLVIASDAGLVRVSGAGGRLDTVLPRVPGAGPVGVAPLMFADGNHVALAGGSIGDTNRLRIARLDTKVVREVAGSALNPLALIDGYLFFGRSEGSIAALRVDAEKTQSVQEAAPVLEGVLTKPQGGVAASIARDGTLLYVKGTSTSYLNILDDHGGRQRITAEERVFREPRFSPDGTKIAVTVWTPANAHDVWVLDLASGALRRITTTGLAMRPEWTPDGKHIAYIATGRTGQDAVWWVPADNSGPAEELFANADGSVGEVTFSPDAKYAVVRTSGVSRDLLLVPMTGERKATPLVASPFFEAHPAVSFDGKWLAYTSNDAGENQIYVRPFLTPGGTVQVSPSGGQEPQWSRDGRIFYRTKTALMEATLRTAPTLAVASQRVVFDDRTTVNNSRAQYGIHPNGKQFVVLRYPAEFFPQMVVVLNWMTEVRAKLAQSERGR